MTYAETKKKLEELRNKNGEAMFRMAISHLIDVGIRNLTEENIKATCELLMKQDDTSSILTNEFQCGLVRLSGEIAKLDHIHVLVYIQNDVAYDVGQGEMARGRAIQLLEECVEWITSYGTDSDSMARDSMRSIGFSNEELKEIGYDYLCHEEED